MADTKISDFTDSGELQTGDLYVIARGANNFKVDESRIGDARGPASATDNNVAAFDGATGKLIKDSGIPDADLVLIEKAAILKNKTISSLDNTIVIPTTDLSDVSASTPSNGDILKYNSATSKYEPSNDSTSNVIVVSDAGIGELTVPDNATLAKVTLLGSGGGGAAGGSSMMVADQSTDVSWQGAGGGGGSSGFTRQLTVQVKPGQVLEYSISDGGAGGVITGGYIPQNGTNGGPTSIKVKSSSTDLLIAEGGKGGDAPTIVTTGGIDYFINGGKGGYSELGGGGAARGFRTEPDGAGSQTIFFGDYGLGGSGDIEPGQDSTATYSGSGAYIDNGHTGGILKGPGGGGSGILGGIPGNAAIGQDAQNGYGAGGGGGSGGEPITNGAMIEGFSGGKGSPGRLSIEFLTRGEVCSESAWEARFANTASGSQEGINKTNTIFDATGGDCTVTLPASTHVGHEFIIYKIDTSANKITLSIPADTTVYSDAGGSEVHVSGTGLHFRYLFSGSASFGVEGHKYWQSTRI
tara:strand:+ start:5045 stop:6616 length:1572 start_codon:yes stop_codon:yes gene_type:complete